MSVLFSSCEEGFGDLISICGLKFELGLLLSGKSRGLLRPASICGLGCSQTEIRIMLFLCFMLLHLVEYNLYHLNQRGSCSRLVDRVGASNVNEVKRSKDFEQRLLMDLGLPGCNQCE